MIIEDGIPAFSWLCAAEIDFVLKIGLFYFAKMHNVAVALLTLV